MRPIAVFRFSPTEGPAYFGDWLDAHSLPWRLIAIDAGERVPDHIAAFSGVAMMGGPMSANDALPWIAPLAALLREAVEANVPVIGHCLGGQLFARALGAPISRAPVAEIGWGDVLVTDEAARRGWFGGRSSFETFQWHYEAFAVPPGATRVLGNSCTPNQAFVFGDRHIGLQCHIEMTDALVETWLASGARELPDRSTAAMQTAADIRRDLDVRIPSLHAVADDVYARWASAIAR
jgi:GMP synthase-like glutamine amidotransferase